MFGPDYACICLTTVRDSAMRELDIYGKYKDKFDFASYDNDIYGPIFVPKKLDSYKEFTNENKTVNYTEKPESEGVVVRVWDNDKRKYRLIKLQTMNYQFNMVLGSKENEENKYKGLIYLYQNGKLTDYIKQNPDKNNKIYNPNPQKLNESFDTIGVVDAVFKACSGELFELFKILYSLKTGKPQEENRELYEVLPKEYKDIMYVIRGIYNKKRAECRAELASLDKNNENDNSNKICTKKYRLCIDDIYNHLKTLPTETFVAFLRIRKLMTNWVRDNVKDDASIKETFKSIFNIKSVHHKLCEIFTNKLYPTIKDDMPPQKGSNKVTEIVDTAN
jgi:hypothetical protein